MSGGIRLGEPCVSTQYSFFLFPKQMISPLYYSTRAKLQACDEEFDWLSSYHSRCFYLDYKAEVTQLESRYLKSNLLLKVCQFTLPFISYSYFSFYRSIKPYSPRHLQRRMFRRRMTMKTCLQPNYRRFCLEASLCAAMWHRNSIWMGRLLLGL